MTRRWYFYAALSVITGLLTGVLLANVLWLLFSTSES
jgi:hypothetical protein